MVWKVMMSAKRNSKEINAERGGNGDMGMKEEVKPNFRTPPN